MIDKKICSICRWFIFSFCGGNNFLVFYFQVRFHLMEIGMAFVFVSGHVKCQKQHRWNRKRSLFDVSVCLSFHTPPAPNKHHSIKLVRKNQRNIRNSFGCSVGWLRNGNQVNDMKMNRKVREEKKKNKENMRKYINEIFNRVCKRNNKNNKEPSLWPMKEEGAPPFFFYIYILYKWMSNWFD